MTRDELIEVLAIASYEANENCVWTEAPTQVADLYMAQVEAQLTALDKAGLIIGHWDIPQEGVIGVGFEEIPLVDPGRIDEEPEDG